MLLGVVVECDESYPLNVRRCEPDRWYGDPGGLVGREAVPTGRDRWEGDGPGVELIGDLQAPAAAGVQDFDFAMADAFLVIVAMARDNGAPSGPVLDQVLNSEELLAHLPGNVP